MDKVTLQFLKVAAPVVFTNNLVALTQRHPKISNSGAEASPSKTKLLRQKLTKTVLFFVCYEVLNKGLRSYTIAPRTRTLVRAAIVFLLHQRIGAFSWGVSIYLLLRAFFSRGLHLKSKVSKPITKALLHPVGMFFALLFHTHYMAHQSAYMAPGYIRIWVSVLPQYYRRQEGQSHGLKKYHEDHNPTPNDYYPVRLCGKARLQALPSNFLTSLKHQTSIFFSLYMLGFLVSFGRMLSATRDSTKIYRAMSEEFKGMLAKTARSSLVLTALAHSVLEIPALYRALSGQEDETKVKKHVPFQLIMASALCAFTLHMEKPGRKGVLVSYLNWRTIECVFRLWFFEIDEQGVAHGNEFLAGLLSSALTTWAVLLSAK